MGNIPLPAGLNVTTTDGIHIFMLILRLIEPLSSTSNGDIYPLVEIVQQPTTAKVLGFHDAIVFLPYYVSKMLEQV